MTRTITCSLWSEARLKTLKSKRSFVGALTDKINDREVYMKGIDASYHYEGYNVFKTGDLDNE